ncbi:MAG: hypothetical protein IMZ74_02745 [Actinobacteria bacterium]|nr:hypothetical protein [Actinomycetota bacterium]
MRALLISALVVLAGAVLGAAGFVVEQSRATWRPQVSATSAGWRVSTSHGLQLGGSALGGDHLAWEAGPFTLLTDLRSGKSRLLGAGATAGSTSAPSMSDNFVVWLEAPASDARAAVVWAYEISRARRARLEDVQGISQSPAVSGTTAVWEADGGGAGSPQIRGADLVTGRRFSLGESGGASELIISDTLVAWAAGRPDPTAPPVITVVDLADGRRWSIAPYPEGQEGSLLGIVLAGRTLVWARATTAAQEDQILAYDLDRPAVRAIAQAADVVPPAADGDLVVWAQPSAEGGTQVMGVRLSGGEPFPIASVQDGSVRSVLVSGKTVAWHVAGAWLFDSYLQTARLP